jgi:phospholipid transport system substrate-binding protein
MSPPMAAERERAAMRRTERTGWRRRELAVLLAAAALGGGGGAPQTASAFIDAAGRELASIMAAGGGEADRLARMEEFISRVVDVENIGRFCLGRYWNRATAAQRAEYLRLLLAFLARAVMGRAGAYGSGRARIVVGAEQAAPDGTRVPTTVSSGTEQPVAVTWLVAGRAPDFRIADVSAEGISLRQTKRDDFSSFLAAHGGDMEAFLAALRAHAS